MIGMKKTKRKVDDPRQSFWDWFVKNEARFKKVNGTEAAHDFLNELIEQLKPFNPWLKALAGPYDDDRYELIITADGDIALFSQVEELVKVAPPVKGWLITAHKPPLGAETMTIEMHGYSFGADNLSFYAVNDEGYPDEINIVMVHPDFNEKEEENFNAGCQIFLQNALGELQTATIIDSLDVRGAPAADEEIELIPVTKLHDYLVWREKEFVEKYAHLDAVRPEESWGVLEATAGEEAKPMIAVIDSSFKDWEYRSAYPWLAQLDIEFEANENGLPSKKTMEAIQKIEDALLVNLENGPETFLVGHDTHDGIRSIYFYTDDYNEVSRIIHVYLETVAPGFKIVFHVRKDKYWKAMDYFFNAIEGGEEEDIEEDEPGEDEE